MITGSLVDDLRKAGIRLHTEMALDWGHKTVVLHLLRRLVCNFDTPQITIREKERVADPKPTQIRFTRLSGV